METLVVALTFHRKLVSFLASLPIPNSLSSASPGDIQKFRLVWKGKSGRTKVHHMSCPQATNLDLSFEAALPGYLPELTAC